MTGTVSCGADELHLRVLESVEVCLLVLDADGVVRFANRFAEQRMGGGQRRLLGERFTSLCEACDAQHIARALKRVAEGEPVRDLELHARASEGHASITRFTLNALSAATAAALGHGSERDARPQIIAAGTDVTDRLQLERKTADAEAMTALSVLTTGLAHDIRNPLNAAKLQLELLMRRAKRVLTADHRPALLAPALLVRSEIERLSTLLDELLELSRPRPIDRRVFSLRDLFDHILKVEAQMARRAGALLTLSLQPEQLEVHADREKLKQVLVNLTTNALDAVAMREAGKVSIRGELHVAGGVRLSVSDNGPGIPPLLLDSVFKPFVTTKPAGTGLGLSIVEKLVAQHGGSVSLMPRVGGGTVVEVHIPA